MFYNTQEAIIFFFHSQIGLFLFCEAFFCGVTLIFRTDSGDLKPSVMVGMHEIFNLCVCVCVASCNVECLRVYLTPKHLPLRGGRICRNL